MAVTPVPQLIFPPLSRAAVLACQFSSWYSTFSSISIKAKVIRPLPTEFKDYLESDGVTVPDGAEDDGPPESTLSDSESSSSTNDGNEDSEGPPPKRFAFPDLDQHIRDTLATFQSAVFPKLNWTSPQDAAWILNPGSPLKCTSPADVYLYLKASDFALHDLDPEKVFDGCVDANDDADYELELVLKKWYAIDRSREMRCFVRDDRLIAICQRDPNFYEFLSQEDSRDTIRRGVQALWEQNIDGKFEGGSHYVFDIILTRSLASGHLIDFNPYAPRTDALLYTYEELLSLYISSNTDALPELRVITSRGEPAANRNAPKYQHNMVPMEALELSQGRGLEEFRDQWMQEVRRASQGDKAGQ